MCACDGDTYSPTKPFLKVNVPGPGYMLEVRQPENCSPRPSALPPPFSFFLSLFLFHTHAVRYTLLSVSLAVNKPRSMCALCSVTHRLSIRPHIKLPLPSTHHSHTHTQTHAYAQPHTCGSCRARPRHDERVSKAIKIVERCPRC